MIDGRNAAIRFDGARSNSLALPSLYALKWNVLYRNSDGGHLTVTGRYNSATETFVLSDWHIRVPFQQIVIEEPDVVPSNQHLIISKSLYRSDFEKSPQFDPDASQFQPAAHQTGSDR